MKVLLATAALLVATLAHTQEYPTRPVRLVVPVTAGGAVDLVTRTVAERLTAALGKQFIVDNRPGAMSSIGAEIVARAAPDGYTLLASSDTLVLLPSLYPKLSFDVEKSFVPIVLMTTQALALGVHASVPAASVKELAALSKAKPGTLSYASSSAVQHMTGELIKRQAGIDMVHVPYRGGGVAIIDLLAGQIPVAVLGSSQMITHARAGKIRVLGVTSATRSPSLPEVPTLNEAGLKGFDVFQWIILLAPARTPPEIVARLNAEATKALKERGVRERLQGAGFEAKGGSAKEVQALLHSERVRWAQLIKELGLKAE
jgi:tripartite-type tricarboxylate transporter receptor subunit TctC